MRPAKLWGNPLYQNVGIGNLSEIYILYTCYLSLNGTKIKFCLKIGLQK